MAVAADYFFCCIFVNESAGDKKSKSVGGSGDLSGGRAGNRADPE